MSSPINMILDKVDWRCARCGVKAGTCNCFYKVTLRCPHCKRTKEVTNDETDPPGTATVEATCELCAEQGVAPEINYYDAKGKPLELISS